MARPDPQNEIWDKHLHPHLRLLLPSSSPPIHLEARLYLPLPLPESINKHINILGEYSTVPKKLEDLDAGLRDGLRDMGVERVVVASHPWGRLGGSMLDPVITSHLITAIYHPYHSHTTDPSTIEGANPDPDSTAVISYNVRGVGLSGGSQPWLGTGSDPNDLAEIEKIGVGLLGDSVKEAFRFGYSWGSLLTILAPFPTASHIPLKKTLLVSPPITVFKGITLLSSKKFPAALKDHHIHLSKPVWVVYGTKDEFTGASTYTHFADEQGKEVVKSIQVDDADHLWRRDEGQKLREVIRDWLDASGENEQMDNKLA
ncbi:uncharacterized protein I303_103748 [Kwoniella dejecticola CBS 10117]|uniref:AB hydrolase-1 domain-containing protein n=1 Tax=Kwoniella dejecticola CBS 10117 TaxID=1296121 RepID=A0A1A6A7L5_9TREE|nr:uncharacterized protein I303_03765 [Kwoniella dejecticola CBS 10117]OBR86047.1 hypothetical protein I303_03765 [Kwoniella dejecticola CBS 10117]